MTLHISIECALALMVYYCVNMGLPARQRLAALPTLAGSHRFADGDSIDGTERRLLWSK